MSGTYVQMPYVSMLYKPKVVTFTFKPSYYLGLGIFVHIHPNQTVDSYSVHRISKRVLTILQFTQEQTINK